MKKTIRLQLFILLITLHSIATSATFVVNTESDLADSDLTDGECITVEDSCSLRAAIQQSNASVGNDSITLPAGTYDLTLTGVNEDLATTGDLDITDHLTINGAGANQTFIDGLRSDRIFHISKGKTTILNAITIRNGLADGLSLNNNVGSGGFGGGIYSEGDLTINDSNLDRNKAFNGGAAIYAVYRGFPVYGGLTVNRSNFTYSEANGGPTDGGSGGFGGHIYAEGIPINISNSVIKDSISTNITGILAGGGIYYMDSTYPPHESSIVNTTISNNRVMSMGGGVHIALGVMDIINSTVSGNSAYVQGGGVSIDSGATVNIVNTTIAFNSAPISAGLHDANGRQLVTLGDSIVSNNVGGNCFTNSIGLLTTGNNIDNDGSCDFSISNLDPLLQPLADNGGPGFSHALGNNSPALNQAGTCLSTDQRSYLRPTTLCDLGSVEMEGTAPETPVTTPIENNQISATNHPTNAAPVAFDIPAAVVAGGILHGIMNAYDPNGDPLTYEITEAPTQGNAGLPVPISNNDFPGGYSYAPLATATGSDSFKYRACDPYLACSEEMTVFISITSGVVSGELNIELTTDTGNVNDLVIVSDDELAAIAPDADYSYPNGAYFFSVDNIPSQQGQSIVTIQLPPEATIADNAVVRKLDNTGTWQTLTNVVNTEFSYAQIDTTNKTITLTLIDNDKFDLNPETGIINDPVAIGIKEKTNVLCNAGTYGTTECIPASPGFYVPIAGATLQTPCETGTYSSSPGATACTQATPGYFVDTVHAVTQTACPAGHYSANAGATACTAATAGFYVSAIAQTSQIACAAGSYSSSQSSTACTLASPGYFVDTTQASAQQTCPAGYYSANAGSTECTAASAGYYVPSTAQSIQTACDAGSYANETASTSCTLASEGYFVAEPAQSQQTPCAIGYYSDTKGATSCKSAPKGSYADSPAATSALSCPAGTTTSTAASTSADACAAESSKLSQSSNGGGGYLGIYLFLLLLSNLFIRRKFISMF